MTMVFELGAIDRHFADFLSRESGGFTPDIMIVISLASNAVANGNICLDLEQIAGREILVNAEEIRVPPLDELLASLRDAPVVGAPGDFRPLVLDRAGRLYLHRYWKYEQDLARLIVDKTKYQYAAPDEKLLADGIHRLFPDQAEYGIDWQRVAALAALRKGFCVISGGPGTGKSSTVVKILALLLEQAADKPLRIALAAPTGKAAARLRESVSRMKDKLDCADTVTERIPHEVSTIHRLLGPIAGSVRFRYSALNPLPYDVVIIDEASMIPLPLMAKLATALKQDTRLILLGDRDQLASVEAGAVLGDICGTVSREPFTQEFDDLLSRLGCERVPVVSSEQIIPPLVDSVVFLKKNYRFPVESGIGALATAVNSGNGAEALALFKSDTCADLCWRDLPRPEGLKRALTETVVGSYRSFLAAETVEEALHRFDSFRILSPLRQGPYGVAAINALVEEILGEHRLIDSSSRWYKGRPVLVTVNDYSLKLFNGDVGIVFPDPEAGGNLRAYFQLPDGGVRKVSPVRLPAHETVYAMTVHKSQGSEFDSVLMILPAHDSEVLTRELVYTGITRAKSGVELWGDETIFVPAVSRRVERKSGLKDALWNSFI